MVAVVSGAGLGLFGTVGRGAGGAGVGQGSDRVYVNSTTGNLIIQSEDERLRAIGLSNVSTRTYNSRGLLDDDNGDNWRLGVQQRVFGLTGQLNTAGSSIKKQGGDGYIATFLYDSALGLYVGTDGEGAHDTLSNSAGQWTWTDGDGRNTQTFASDGRLLRAADRFGNTLSYEYTGTRLTRISDASGQSTYLDYDASGRNLTAVRTVSDGVTQTRTRYSYDGSERLMEVQTDLTPADNSVTDGKTFTTRYSYEGASRRITKLSHSDGTSVSFTYEQGGDGQYRVSSYTEGEASLGRTTRFTYEAVGGSQILAAPGQALAATVGDPLGATVLTNFVPVREVSVAQGAWRYYALEVPAGMGELSIASHLGSGDADLYVRRGALPTLEQYDGISDANPDNEELLYLSDPAAGVWYIGVYGYGDVAGLELEAHTQSTVEIALQPGEIVSELSGVTDTQRLFRFEVPVGTVSFRVTLTGPNGDADLYLMHDAPVDLQDPDEYSEGGTTEESVFIGYHAPGIWHVLVKGYERFDDAQLVVHLNLPNEQALPPSVRVAHSQLAQAGTAQPLSVQAEGQGALSYEWTQVGGAAVVLSGANTATPSFTAPASNGVLRFRVQVRDAQGITTSAVTEVQVAGGSAAPAPVSGQTRTRITDALGAVTTQVHDARGRLLSVQGPLSSTEYLYDEADNLTALIEDADGARRTTVLEYDARGNNVLTRSAAGQVQSRTFNARNQLLTETRYRVADPDGAGVAQPSTPVTTRYVYGANDRLLFAVSAEGRVTQFQYRSDGLRSASITYSQARYDTTSLPPTASLTEAQLQSWVSAQGTTPRERIDLTYDFRGQLASETHYASLNASGVGASQGASRIQYVYDQYGRLLQQLGALGSTLTPNPADATLTSSITYVYDGHDRLIASSRALQAGEVQTTLTQYDDAGHRILTTLANGRVSIATYDSSGTVKSEVQSSGMTQLARVRFVHDAAGRLRQQIDADDLTQHSLYDSEGRLAGSIDADGSLTRFVYDDFGQPIKTIRYADRLSAAALASLTDANGAPTGVTIEMLLTGLPSTVGRGSDQITRTVFDAAGRAVFTLAPNGALTQNFYDGAGWLTDQIEYATPLTVSASTNLARPEDVTVTTDAKDRHSRIFYDRDGTVRARLDAAGYLVELVTDGAGRLREQVGYATVSSAALRANGTLEQLRPAAAAKDQHSYFFYDAQGRSIAVLDAEGYLSETVFDVAGRVQEQLRHDQVLSYQSDLTTLKAQLTATHEVRRTRFEYDGADRLVRQTDFQGTVAEFAYDAIGQRIRTTAAAGTSEARTVFERYDLLGRVTQRLSGEGVAQLTAGLSPAQVNEIWDRYGVRYEYSAGALLTSATSRPNDTDVNTTRYFYDTDGALRFEVNALGEVNEKRYDALGQLTESIAYAKRIATDGLTGGFITDTLTTRVTQALDAERDAHTYFSYTLTGQLKSTLTAGGALSTSSYTTFGELSARVDKLDATHDYRTEFTYDARGLQLSERADPAALNLESTQQYDAFGRLTASTDRAGKTTRIDYDRLGRAMATEDALGARRITTYDAFSRTLTTTNALGAITRYRYDAALRSTTVTTPEGIAVTTTVNRHGQTLSVAAAGNLTTYEYTRDGQLKRSADALGTLEEHEYDRGGRELIARDARGVPTNFTYDPVGRVLTQSVEVDGVAQVTAYEYDGEGHLTRSTAADGTVTTTTYDADGRIKQRAVDPAGLNLRTEYGYDAGGRVITTIEGAGSTQPRLTRYSFDALDRQIEQVLDPGTNKLNLTQKFRYDANGNLTRTIDALGNSTWFIFDANGHAIQSVDATGAVTETRYDAEGRVIATLAYATRVDTTSFGDVVARVTLAASSLDRLTQFVADADGREAYQIDAGGTVTERSFDERGNITRTRIYARAVALQSYASITAIRTALTAAGNDLNTPAASDRLSFTAFDARGKSVFTADAAGAVARIERDSQGNVTRTTAFATLRSTTLPMDLASLRTWAEQGAIATHPDNRTERFWYDALGRQVFNLDADNALTETRYRDTEHKTTTILYRDRVSLAVDATLAQVRANAVVAGFNASRDKVSTSETDAAGRVMRIYDALSSTTASSYVQYLYDAVGNRTTTIDPRGIELAERNSDWARIQRGLLGFPSDAGVLTEPLREALRARYSTVVTFDAAGRELTSTDALGGVTRKSYDAQGNLVTLTDARGLKGYTYYGADGRARLQIDPLGFATELRYDTFGNVTEELAYANALSGTYDETSSIASLLGRITTSASDRKLARSFDARGSVETVTYFNSPSNYTEEFQYDAFGQKTRFKDRNNAVYNYEYTARGELRKEVSPQVEVVTQVLPTLVTQQLRLETLSDYNAFGERSALTEAAGTAQQRITRYSYDHAGRAARIEAPSFHVYDRATDANTPITPLTQQFYDTAGNLIRQIDPNGGVTVNYYDSRNLLIATVSPGGVLSQFEHDAVGNETLSRIYGTRLGAVDPSAQPTPVDPDDYRELKQVYDANNRRFATFTRSETLYSLARAVPTDTTEVPRSAYYTDAVVTYAFYDANGNVVETIDGNSNRTRSYYDGAGNRILQVDAARYVTHFEYSAQGQVIRERRLAGRLDKSFFDALTPASSVASILAAVPAGESRIAEFSFDALGRQTAERKLAVTYSRLDANGKPVSVTGDVVTSTEYDGNDNVLAQTRADGGRFDFSYDALNRRTSARDPQFEAFIAAGQPLASVRSEQQFKYDAYGNEVLRRSLGSTAAEDRVVVQQFDVAGNLRLRREADGAILGYEYDVSGNTVRTQRTVRDVNLVTHDYRTYTRFDILNREVSRQDVEDQGTPAQETRETQDTRYNGYGDIEAKGINGQFQEIYKYDKLGRLFFTNKETGTPRLYVYDANGNAVVEVQALQTDLSLLKGPADVALLTPLEAQFTLSLYDQRNQLIEVFEPPMMFDDLFAAPPSLPPGTGTQGNPAEMLASLGLFTPSGFSDPLGGSVPYTTPQPKLLSESTSPPKTGFGPPPSSEVTTGENLAAAQYTLAYLGISTTPVDTIGEPVRISDLPSMDDTRRTVIDTQTRTNKVTTTANVVEGGILVAIDVTVITTTDVLTRTTIFTRSMTQTRIDDDKESLKQTWVATVDPNVITVRTITTHVERVSVVKNVSTTGKSAYAGAQGTVSFAPALSVSATVIKALRNGRIEYQVNVPVVSFPALGTDPIRIYVDYAAGSTFKDSYGNESLSFLLANKYPTRIRYEKAGQTLAVITVTETPDDSPPHSITYYSSIPGFVTLQGLPGGADSVTLRVLGVDYQATAGTPSGGVREFQVVGNFATGQAFEFWAYASSVPVEHGKGSLGTAAYLREHSFTTTTKFIEQYEVRTNTSANSRASNPVLTNQLQNNYFQNLIRVLTTGESKRNVIHRTQAYDAFGEVISQTDGRRNTTELFYDKLGNVVRQVQPETLIYSESGALPSARPTTYNYFNQLGEQIGIQDANSVALSPGAPYYNTRVLVNGRVVKEYDAEGNVTRYTYDRLGDQRQKIDALNQETAYKYDAAGRLLEQTRYEASGAAHSKDLYEYADGNRIAHTNALGYRETYVYDGQSRIRLSTSFEGRKTHYDYTYRSALAGIGGYEKVTKTDGVNGEDTLIDGNDYFGKIRYHEDLGDHNFTYTYNYAGLLSGQTGSSGQDIRYTYYLNGAIRYIDDVGIDTHAEFVYDENGNRVGEYLSKNVLVAGSQNVQPYQVARVTYDELNRVSRVWEEGRFEITYTYDAVGNRRSVTSKYFDLLTGNNQVQEFYYKYDKLNRFTVTLGQRKASGEIYRGTTGYEIEYDALGRRMSAISEFLQEGTNTPQYVKETYTYDRIDRVKDVSIFNKDARGAVVQVGGTHRRNSVVGSLLEYTVYNKEGSTETPTSHVAYTYDRDELTKSEIKTTSNNTSRRDRTLYNYDGDGILTSTVGNTINADGNVIDSADEVDTTFAYEKWDSYKQSVVTVMVRGANTRIGSSLYRYDVNGHISELVDSQANRTLRYINDANGQVLKRYQIDREVNGSDKPAIVRNFYYLNGRGIGDTGNDRVERRVDYAQQLAEAEKTDKRGRTSQVNPQLDRRISPVTSSDFDQNFQPINDSFPAKTASTHIVQPNETLQTIALAMYGDSQYWYVIAEANGLTGNDQLVSGLRLSVPNIVANTRNNANTFRPYDIEAALGKTDPTLPPPPPPPKGKGCGVVAIVLIVAVAIAATVFTAGLASGLAGTLGGNFAAGAAVLTGNAAAVGAIGVTGVVAAAAAGGVVGSVLSQGVAIAAGLQRGFDFKAVALGAIGAGVSAGLGSLITGSNTLGTVANLAGRNPYTFAALNGAASSALTQGISVATGLQQSFSWREVAISTLAAPVAQAFGKGAGALAGYAGAAPGITQFADRFASGVGSSLVRRAFGRKIDTATIIGEAGGNALGQGITDGLANQEVRTQIQREDADAVGVFDQLVKEGRSPLDAAAAVRNKDLVGVIKDGKRLNDLLATKYGGHSFDELSDVEQAELLDGVFGKVVVTDLGFGPNPAVPNERRRLGIGLSKAIVSATDAVGNAVEVLGERNVELALKTVGIALGGIPKAAVNFAVGEKIDALTQAVLGPVEDAVATFLGEHAFGAETSQEQADVAPASKLAAGVTLGILGSVITVSSVKNLFERLKNGRRVKVDAERRIRERREELNFNLDAEAVFPGGIRRFIPRGEVRVSDAHSINTIGSKTRFGEGNKNTPKTVLTGDIDINADLDIIRKGNGVLLDNGDISVPGGRVYRSKANGTVFPVTGPGTVQLTQAEFGLLTQIVKSGGLTGDAKRAFDGLSSRGNAGITAASEAKLLDLYRSRQR